jgi:peptidyl-prolyl cis-trans isomerase C
MSQFLRAPWTLASAVIVIAALSACNKNQQAAAPAPGAPTPASTPAVATVNGTDISRSEYDAFTKGILQGKQQELTAEQKNQILDNLINTQVVADQAVKDGLDKDPDVAARLQVVKLRVLTDAEIQKFVKSHDPTDAELHAEFDRQAAATDLTEYHARHILVAKDKKDLAVDLIKKLNHGGKFDELAKANSIDPGSKQTGGDLGWFNTARMVKPFADAVKQLKKGEITQQPVETQFGWHIIELEDTRPANFEQANKPPLQQAVMEKKVQDYIDSLKKDAKIDKHL